MSKSMVWDPVCPRCKMTVSAEMWYNHMSVCRGRARSPGAIRNRRLRQTSVVVARAGPHGNPGPRSHPTTSKKVKATSNVCQKGGQKPQGTPGQPQRAQHQCLGASQDGYETTNRYPLEARNQGAETLNQACCLSPPPPPPTPPQSCSQEKQSNHFPCRVCHLVLLSKLDRNIHMSKYHRACPIPQTCVFCGDLLPSKSAYLKHKVVQHPQQRLAASNASILRCPTKQASPIEGAPVSTTIPPSVSIPTSNTLLSNSDGTLPVITQEIMVTTGLAEKLSETSSPILE